MALLLHKCVCFIQTSRANATVRWHFYFASLYVAIIHHAWVQLSDGTSTSQVCMFWTNITRECSSMMALLLQKCVCCTHTSRVSATVRWHSYFKSVYVSNKHHAWVQTVIWLFECTRVYIFKHTWGGAQLSDGTSTSQGCNLQTQTTLEFSCQMGLLLHKCVCFKQTICMRANVRLHFYFASAYISNKHYAWVQLSHGTSTSQVCMLHTDITRECSCQMALILHKCVCLNHTCDKSAATRWHFHLTRVYISKWHEAWVQQSNCTSTSLVFMFQYETTRECNCHMALLLHKCACSRHTRDVSAHVIWQL
jgi:hypothetical protein